MSTKKSQPQSKDLLMLKGKKFLITKETQYYSPLTNLFLLFL